MADSNEIVDTAAFEDLSFCAQTLKSGARRERQIAASAFSAAAKEDAASVLPYSGALVDALDCPEARTRWECLDALTALVPSGFPEMNEALVGADASFFDEDSGPVRLAAFRFLCVLGSLSSEWSLKVWPTLNEGIQCYHGDLEFQAMLVALIDFSTTDLDPQVRSELAHRMSFDAENARGSLRRRAETIVSNCS